MVWPVAQLSSEFKRSQLRAIAWGAETAGLGLYAALKALHIAANSSVGIKAGRPVTSTSSNGHSVSFYTPPIGAQIQPLDMAMLAEELVVAYEWALGELDIDQPDATDLSQDSAIAAQMRQHDGLNAATEYTMEFTNLRNS
jgi:hypothetical protein